MRRKLNKSDADQVLAELAQGRAALNRLLAGLPPNSGTAHLARLVVSNMDDLATLLTGDRQYFHSASQPASHLIPPQEED